MTARHIRRRICRFFGLTAAGGIFALCGCHVEPALTRQETGGKHLYEMRCAHCHEDNDLALKKVPPNLHTVFDHKTLPSGIPATDEAVRQNVLAGKGMMPGFAGRFSEEQMAALLAYLHTGVR
jgi:mono/diheme cytochrome c family protein